MDPDAVEIRVLGCLIEKQRTTPDAYPLSLNALRLACNQSTNRDPVVDYDENAIRDALQHLYRRGWTRLTSGHGSRAAKYRHLLDEALGLGRDEIAILAVLMLRGPQTPGELKQRVERLHRFDDLAAVHATLESLIGRDRVARLERRPGQKEERYQQLLGGEEPQTVATGPAPSYAAAPAHPAALAPAPAPPPAPAGPDPATSARIDELERKLEALERELAELREALGA
ncbi:YceH family protein [Conexibacter sp. JD483]|uniref:YceH family protein n=1 Tax=unclassified Conexibacter TaxID=2627773 RepID=UPI002728C17D|nr:MULTISPECIES: YceH family protein [unclassified Conexibacter]MDO8184216.1 YceH family protein [Conexibacter sp. CPCC 205706]MDO8197208.1 YceH family protein [Conexibacter sp. CPCC 205762]MDR9367477.1 YceH family protein [Conexibacter sp. JD483]